MMDFQYKLALGLLIAMVGFVQLAIFATGVWQIFGIVNAVICLVASSGAATCPVWAFKND